MSEHGIHPKGVTVLLLPEAVSEKSEGGIITATPTELDRIQHAQVEGVVIEIAPCAWEDEPEHRAKVGDNVIFAKFAGTIVKGNDGKSYRLVNDRDIVAVKDKK